MLYEVITAEEAAEVDIAAEKAAIETIIEKQRDAAYQGSYEGEEEVWAQEPYIVRMIGNTGDRMIGWDSIGANFV